MNLKSSWPAPFYFCAENWGLAVYLLEHLEHLGCVACPQVEGMFGTLDILLPCAFEVSAGVPCLPSIRCWGTLAFKLAFKPHETNADQHRVRRLEREAGAWSCL